MDTQLRHRPASPFRLVLLAALVVLSLSSCGVSRHLPADATLLDRVEIVSVGDEVSESEVRANLKQTANTRLFGLVRWPMHLYCLSGQGDNFINRTLRNLGEQPRAYDPGATQLSAENIRRSLVSQGWLKAEVDAKAVTADRRTRVTYFINTREAYRLSSLQWLSADTALLANVKADAAHSLLHVGDPLDTKTLGKERTRIATALQQKGYYTFTKDLVSYVADTLRNSTDVALTIRIRSGVPAAVDAEGVARAGVARQFRIDSVTVASEGPRFLKESVLEEQNFIHIGDLYDPSAVQKTYASYNRFPAIKYTNIAFNELTDSTLACRIAVAPAKRYSSGVELDVTNTAGDFGVATSASITDRNIAHSANQFFLKGRYAYENMTQLKDYAGHQFTEYGLETALTMPRTMLPFLGGRLPQVSDASTRVDLQFDYQNRPEFNRRVLSGAWSYLFTLIGGSQLRWDMAGVNLVAVPWKNQTFIDNYLSQYDSRNSILKYNYEDLFILRTGGTFSYSHTHSAGHRDRLLAGDDVRFGVETAGNVLTWLSRGLQAQKDEMGQYRVGNIAFARYVKGDFAWTHNLRFPSGHAVVGHVALGAAFPYGNSKMLPFEKRYYAGGANSVRGWSFRGLGPGRYVPKNGTIDYINQSGDIRFFSSIEYRPVIYNKLHGALFVDAGNIWTIYDYDDQPGGRFRADTFLQQIAVAYGAGLRYDLSFVVVRLDFGFKAINPVYDEGPLRYPILHPNLRRDMAWHFAVGYPF